MPWLMNTAARTGVQSPNHVSLDDEALFSTLHELVRKLAQLRDGEVHPSVLRDGLRAVLEEDGRGARVRGLAVRL